MAMFGCLLSSHTGTPHTHFRVPVPLSSHGHQLASKSLTNPYQHNHQHPSSIPQPIQIVFCSSISSVTVTIFVLSASNTSHTLSSSNYSVTIIIPTFLSQFKNRKLSQYFSEFFYHYIMQTTYHSYPQHPSANSPIKNSIYHNSLYINQYDSRNRFLEQFDLYLGVANYQIILFVCLFVCLFASCTYYLFADSGIYLSSPIPISHAGFCCLVFCCWK